MSSDRRVAALVSAFATHVPIDEAETLAVTHLHRLLSGDGDPFARATLPAHVTASAVVLDPRRQVVLLHLHRRLGRWLQPGGHIELAERPEDAAVRETLEETAVAVCHPAAGPVIVHLDEHPGPDGHIHLDLRYLLLADSTAPTLGTGETAGEGPGASLRWTGLSEVRDMTDPSLARAVDAVRSRLRGGTDGAPVPPRRAGRPGPPPPSRYHATPRAPGPVA
jgi:8-oxo-dGTP pyrophosphatase MutT (NUDIX family)